jgi:hypothetical protein
MDCGYERRRRDSIDMRRAGWSLTVAHFLAQSIFVINDPQAPKVRQALRRGALVIVSMLAECSAAWHHDQGQAGFKPRQDRSHAGMGDDEIGRPDPFVGFGTVDEVLPLNVHRAK